MPEEQVFRLEFRLDYAVVNSVSKLFLKNM